MSRGAWIPIRTFSPMIASTDTSMSSPIMMLWLDFLVRTSMRFLRASRRTIDPSERFERPQHARATGHTGSLGSRPPMARRSLRPQLNQIRTWVRQGRTDAWIAHQLEATVQQIEAFRKEHDLLPDDAEGTAGAGGGGGGGGARGGEGNPRRRPRPRRGPRAPPPRSRRPRGHLRPRRGGL